MTDNLFSIFDSLTDEQFDQIMSNAKRAVWNDADREHKCTLSKAPLLQCCEEWRCEPCQSRHLLSAHTERQQKVWWNLHLASQLIQPPPPQSGREGAKEAKKVKKLVTYNKHDTQINADMVKFFEGLSAEDLVKAIELLKGEV